MTLRRPLCVASFIAACAMLAPHSMAQQDHDHDHETREAGKHVHGVVDAVVSVEGPGAIVEIQSPMWNLIGFEHAPSNQIEANEWVAAAHRLKGPDNIVKFPAAADCSLVSSDLGPFSPAKKSGEADHDDGADGDHHDHDKHREDDTHDHEHRDLHDAVLRWTFQCETPKAIRSVEFAVFQSFTRIEGADAVLFTEGGQASGSLGPGSNVIRVK